MGKADWNPDQEESRLVLRTHKEGGKRCTNVREGALLFSVIKCTEHPWAALCTSWPLYLTVWGHLPSLRV